MKLIHICLSTMLVSGLTADCMDMMDQPLSKTQCPQLVKCRDGEMFDRLDTAFKKHEQFLSFYELNNKIFDETRDLKSEGERQQLLNKLGRSVQLLAEAVGLMTAGQQITKFSYKVILETINGIKLYLAAGKSEEAAKIIVKHVGKNVLRDVVMGQAELLAQLNEFGKSTRSYDQALDKLRKDLGKYNQAMWLYSKHVEENSRIIEQVNGIKNQIDTLCG